MKRILSLAVAAVAAAALVLAILGWRAWTAESDAEGTIMVRVAPGASLHSVSADLRQQGVLKHRRLFLLAARLRGDGHHLAVGRYALPRSASPREILDILLSGATIPVVVTLPEGLEAAALATIVADSLGLAASAILVAADSLVAGDAEASMTLDERDAMAAVVGAVTRPSGQGVHWCEGYLAPDTYHFAEGTSAEAVAATLVGLQRSRVDSALSVAGPAAANLSGHGLLTLAAVVEAEARLPEERERIAAVYHNRLAAGMRLEADPTVAFWLEKRGERLLYRDLEIDSPYNTYRRRGLPAGPIGAPGLAALLATARPDTTCDALYFVADGNGGHVFSRTHAEHQRAVERYRQLMRERRR